MVWTKEQLAEIPEVYRDFMLVLKPVVDSRRPEAVLRITGIPFGMIFSALTDKYAYSTEQVRMLADNLRREGYVVEDRLGFFTPTGKGEQLILALAGSEAALNELVPPLPSL